MVENKELVGTSSAVGGTMSPYYLGPSDNPGTAITPVTLNGDNYAEWASELENALRAKRKFGFVNGSLKMPDEIMRSQWRLRCGGRLLLWLLVGSG